MCLCVYALPVLTLARPAAATADAAAFDPRSCRMRVCPHTHTHQSKEKKKKERKLKRDKKEKRKKRGGSSSSSSSSEEDESDAAPDKEEVLGNVASASQGG